MAVRGGPVSRLLFPVGELVGGYYRGDGLGYSHSLTLTADHRFAFSDAGHMEGHRDDAEANRGKWRVNGDRLLLLPERPMPRMQTRFVPLKWEQRLYLIDEHEMPTFCNMAATHSWLMDYLLNQRRSFYDYLKRHWPNTAPKGYQEGKEQPYPPLSPDIRPRMPERYRVFYERGPIRARVVKVLPPVSKTILQTRQRTRIPDTALHLLLDRGVDAGMRPGLLLADRDHLPITDNLIVIAVEATVARAVRVDFPSQDWSLPGPLGREFTSGEWLGAERLGKAWDGFERRRVPYDTGWDWPPWATALHDDWHINTIEFAL